MSTLYYIFLGIIFIDAAIGLTLWRGRLLSSKFIPIVWLATISILDEIAAYYFRLRFHNNLMVYYTSSSIEYACLVWFLNINTDFTTVKKAIRYSIILFFIARVGFLYFFIQLDGYSASHLNGYFIITQDLLITTFCIFYFRSIFNHVSDYKPLDFSVLIIASGMLFYYAFDSIFRLAYNYTFNVYLHKLVTSGAKIGEVQKAAAIQAYAKFKQLGQLIFFTNILLYLCIFTAFIKNAIIVKKYNIGARKS